ncbi:MAG: amidohydrolase family protein [Bdellovibrio sp.]|nr:amidohydrolase family protein [Bdellovibrio sp.]
MFLKIHNAFDSHCHFLGTGQIAAGLSLKNLKSADDVKDLQILPNHHQHNWLVGFGWDQNLWVNPTFPTSATLDKYFETIPVFFARADGHSSWVNSVGIAELKKLGYDFSKDPVGGKIERDSHGRPTGILTDQAHIQALQKIPYFTESQQTDFLKLSQKLFNQGGYTHVRDLSMTATQWKLLAQMSEKKELTVCVEGFVTIENLNDLPRALEDIKWMQQNPNRHLRIQGIKLFLDGSLGSRTAFVSENYLGTEQKGILCWDLADVKTVLAATWSKQLEFAVHTIGDEAVHQMVQVARSVSAEGILGRLHLEHVQVMRPETIQMMKPLHISCHMQPCHWLSDQSWMNQALAPATIKNTFQWESLRRNKIDLHFGSDSPIEPTSFLLNYNALTESAKKGWPKLGDDWMKFHSHPDKSWNSSFTEFTEEKIHQVYFDGEPVL